MSFKYGVVIPTLGIVEEFILNFENIVQNLVEDTHVVLVINALNKSDLQRSSEIAKLTFLKESKIVGYKNVKLSVIEHDHPLGYAKACNEGYLFLKKHGLTDYVYFVNDDIILFNNQWIYNLEQAINSERFNIPDLKVENSNHISYSEEEHGLKTGMSSAICDNASGSNNVDTYFLSHNRSKLSLIEKANALISSNLYPIHATRIAGVVVCLSKELCLDVELDCGIYDEHTFKVGGFEDDDLSIRIEQKGWIGCVDTKTIVSHVGSRSLDKFDSAVRGFNNATCFYKKYEYLTQGQKIVGGLYRVKLNTVQDLIYFKSSLMRTSQLTDKLCIVLTDNLFTIVNSFDFNFQMQKLTSLDLEIIRLNSETENYESAIKNWLCSFSEYKFEDIYLHVWKEEMHEKHERNKVIQLARESKCDWGFSVDHDEVIEERITKNFIQNLATNPNPSIKGYLVTWTNHWESPNVVRKDVPIDDGGNLLGGMAGVRFFKIDNRNIVGGGYKGLHCGPSPIMSNLCYSNCNISMRHFSMLRSIDRDVKTSYYNSLDKEVNRLLVGSNNYNHISKNEMIQVSQYEPRTAFGCTMMFHKDEVWQYCIIWMNRLYGVADSFILTWTSEWNDEDKVWLELPLEQWPTKENWFSTGPNFEVAYCSRLFKVQIEHYKFSLDDGFANARNYGIQKLREKTSTNPYMRWGAFFDPDEMCGDEIQFARAITACCKTINLHGFIVRYKNTLARNYEQGQKVEYAMSESTRFFRLDLNMNMSGKIHESFNYFFEDMYRNGISPKLTYFPITLVNLSVPTVQQMNKKLEKYTKILQIQLQEDPLDSGSWVALGLQAYNDGYIKEAITCYERGVLCAGQKYLAFEQMALHHLRVSKDYMLHCIERLPTNHNKVKEFSKVLEILHKVVPPIKMLDTEPQQFEMPHFPYDKISNEYGILISGDHDVQDRDRSD